MKAIKGDYALISKRDCVSFKVMYADDANLVQLQRLNVIEGNVDELHVCIAVHNWGQVLWSSTMPYKKFESNFLNGRKPHLEYPEGCFVHVLFGVMTQTGFVKLCEEGHNFDEVKDFKVEFYYSHYRVPAKLV